MAIRALSLIGGASLVLGACVTQPGQTTYIPVDAQKCATAQLAVAAGEILLGEGREEFTAYLEKAKRLVDLYCALVPAEPTEAPV